MACKLKCPKCKKVLRLDRDIDKAAQGVYLVVEAGGKNTIECVPCGHKGTVKEFDQD